MIFDFRVFTITYALAISRPFAQLFDPMIFTCNEELDALQAIQLASDALVDLVPYFTSMHTCDDEVPRPVKRARNQPEEEEKEESSAIVPFGGGDAKSLILPYLPPHLASNKQFVSFAAMKAQTNKMSVVQFDVWIEKQEAAIDLRRTAKIDELKARATLAHARRTSIIETDVRCGVERVFKTKFDAPCGYECGKTIAIDNFYVLRYGDAFTLCCKGCYDVKCEMANGRAERVKNVDSSNAWQHHHGRNVRALCYICGDRQPKFHFYLDSWEAGHDVAHSKDGDKSPENLAPIHPRCNKDQKKKTFAQYMNGE